MSESWTREEVEATVADYFHMLTMELAEQQQSRTNKSRTALTAERRRS